MLASQCSLAYCKLPSANAARNAATLGTKTASVWILIGQNSEVWGLQLGIAIPRSGGGEGITHTPIWLGNGQDKRPSFEKEQAVYYSNEVVVENG